MRIISSASPLAGAVDDGAANRVTEQGETQVCRCRIVGQIELFATHGVYGHVVAVHAVSDGRGCTNVSLEAASFAKVMALPSDSPGLSPPAPAGRSVIVAGRLATAQCQKPGAVGASASYTVTAKLRVSSGMPDQLNCGEISEPPVPMMPRPTSSLRDGSPSVIDSDFSVKVGSCGRASYGEFT